MERSDLGNPSIHEDFASGHEVTVVAGQEADHLCDVGGNSIPADGGDVGGLGEIGGQLGLVRADNAGKPRRVDNAGADRIDADVPALEVGRPGAGERPDGRLCRAIDAPFGEAFTRDDRGVQNDGRSGGEQRKRLFEP